ncbi:MAG: radical SAM protein [Saprospiraceae bacterium]
METARKAEAVLKDPALEAPLKAIAQKVFSGERITFDEGVLLFEKAPLSFLGVLANFIREARHGEKTYFNRNFHIEPTNVCLYTCTFCSYSRLIKQRSDGWEYSMDEIMDIVRSYDGQPVTEVHIVGGVLPQYDVPFYEELFQRIRAHRPELHIKALTPVEYHYIFKKAKISYERDMARMKAAGLDSMPGGGAEIFHPEIRDQIAGGKCNAEQWLRIHEIWHELGIAPMRPCYYLALSNSNIVSITWSDCGNYGIKPEDSRLLSRLNSGIKRTRCRTFPR